MNLTIKDVSETSKKTFDSLKETKNIISSTLFDQLITTFTQPTNGNTEVNPAEFLNLKTENQGLQQTNTELNQQNQHLQTQLAQAAKQIADLQAQLQTEQTTNKLAENQFICSPSPEFKNNIVKARQAIEKRGDVLKNPEALTDAEYCNKVAIFSLKYFFLNEFPKFQ